MATPAAPLPQIGMTAGKPPPFPLLDLTWQGFHWELLSCVCVCVWSSHVSPHCASRVSCYHTGKPQLTRERDCCLDSAASHRVSVCVAAPWKSLVYVCVHEHMIVPSFLSHYFCLLVSPETKDLHLHVTGEIRAWAAVWLRSCLLPLLFSPPAIFHSYTQACLHDKH